MSVEVRWIPAAKDSFGALGLITDFALRFWFAILALAWWIAYRTRVGFRRLDELPSRFFILLKTA
jgi:hypothetical protein